MENQVEQLCARAVKGDLPAASALLSLFYERIYGWFRRMAGNEEEAADLTQKTFCKVWLALPSYKGNSSFSTWLHAVGYHVYVDWRRKKNPGQEQPQAWWDSCAAVTTTPFEAAAERELAERLYGCVENLEEELRQVVHVHYYQGLSLKETAEVLKLATSTVKYRLRQSLAELQSQMAEPKQQSRRPAARKGGAL